VADLAPHKKTPACAARDPWGRVVELRAAGKDDTAGRVAKKLLGVQGPPMTEEVKEKLRRHNDEHKEEIERRRKIKAALRKAVSRPRGQR
jgi:phosphoglycerate-specific signal transduction histidine kinase